MPRQYAKILTRCNLSPTALRNRRYGPRKYAKSQTCCILSLICRKYSSDIAHFPVPSRNNKNTYPVKISYIFWKNYALKKNLNFGIKPDFTYYRNSLHPLKNFLYFPKNPSALSSPKYEKKIHPEKIYYFVPPSFLPKIPHISG